MPLRDHFKPPLSKKSSWEGFHGQWPAMIVQHLRKSLPAGFVAEPRVHLGTQVEIDIATFETESAGYLSSSSNGGGVATAVLAPTKPTFAVETSLPENDEYEVRVYDAAHGRRLVAAIEIVSPRNKDRPESRNVFIAKCNELLRRGVAVSIVDLVTVRQTNLYSDLLAFIGHSDPSFGETPPSIYAASCRLVVREKRAILEAWSYTLSIGQPLPTIPLWLTETGGVHLNLEESYEQACHDLWIE